MVGVFRILIGLAALSAVTPALAGDTGASISTRAAIREIEQSAAVVRIELRAARGSGAVIGARCASEKLSEVHAQLRLANRTAFGENDRRQRFMLDTARERAREIARSAHQCRQIDAHTRVIARAS